MKQFVIIAAVFAVAFADGPVIGDCHKKLSAAECTAHFSNYSNDVNSHLSEYAKQLIKKSYDFLILSAEFSKFTQNRPGFEKLYHDISDASWNEAIDLMKYQTKRGGKVNFYTNSTSAHGIPLKVSQQFSYGMDETKSLAFALDYEKIMAVEIHAIHSKVSQGHHKDPDVSQYLEEEIIEDQSGVIRKLAGYVNDLTKITEKDGDKNVFDLGKQLFDDYLVKQ